MCVIQNIGEFHCFVTVEVVDVLAIYEGATNAKS